MKSDIRSFNAKKIIALVLSISVAFFVLLSIFTIIIKNSKNDYSPSAAVSISDLSSLQNFTNRVNDGESDLDAILTRDINCGGTALRCIGRYIDYYSGTFNGNGFTISNFKTDYSDMCDSAIMKYAQGFFGYTNGATICDLRLTNFEHIMSNALDASVSVGGLVGYPYNTKILRCQVDNFIIRSNYPNQAYIGGITGYGENGGVIENCYVTEFKHSGYFSNMSKSCVYRIAGIAAYADTVSQCVFQPGGSVWTINYATHSSNGSYNSYNLYYGAQNHIIDDYVSAGQVSLSDATNSYSSTGPHYFRGISYKSNAGGKTATNGYGDSLPWYYNTSYSAWPLLRKFLSWKIISVTVSNPSVATLTGTTSFEIPTDASISISNRTSTTPTINGNSVVVKVNNSNYRFVEWRVSGNSAVAVIEALYATVIFKGASNSNRTSDVTFTVPDGTTISASIPNNKSYVSFSFSDINGSQNVKYQAISGAYYCSYRGMSSSTKTLKAGESIEIAPTFSLKSYTITFS